MIDLAVLLLFVAGQPESAPPTEPPPQEVSGVTVTARRIPHTPLVTVTGAPACPAPDPAHFIADRDPAVVDSYPRPGSALRPGLIQVRVTFDAPMSCYAEVAAEGGDADPCEAQGTWALPDRKSFLTECKLEPGATYTLKFQKVGDQGFVGMSGRPALPFVLKFVVLPGPAVTTWADAQRSDPGPPGGRATSAYVTCTGAKAIGPNGDCRRQGMRAPEPPP